MVSFEQAGAFLDEAVDKLPEEIFRDLNGGVNLLPETRRSEDGRYVLGLYHHDHMGRYVEIFYGSFLALYGDLSPQAFRRELEKTLRHELTHHIENKAGDRTLEHWDELQTALWEQGQPLDTDSILFVCGDGVLSCAAELLFHALLPGDFPSMLCSHAALHPAPFPPQAVKAAAGLGIELDGLSSPVMDGAEMSRFGAILCMSMDQADELAERCPELDERILCLGPKDITAPRTPGGWPRVLRRLRKEILFLIDELSAGREAP